jgi:membrane associated rhomboid family serine protease
VRGLFFLWIFFTTIEIPAMLFIVGWFVLQLISSLTTVGAEDIGATQIAFLAHIGGFVTGLLLAFLFRQDKQGNNLLSKDI